MSGPQGENMPRPSRSGSFDGAQAPPSTPLDAQNPWPGLAAYDEASRAFFHGRDENAAELFRLVRRAPLTVLYGKSGLGKSSLVQAGLFPRLRAGHYLPVWLRVDFSDDAEYAPLEQVARRLDEEIGRARAECPAREPGEELWQFLHRNDLEIWSADNFLVTPVLVFDQFEELFSRNGGSGERIGAVVDALADLIENRIPAAVTSAPAERRARLDLNAQRYRIVLAFREDFLPDIETWKDKVPSLLRSRLRLLPMSRDQAIAATEQAGAAVLDRGVAAQIVDFVANRESGVDHGEVEVEPVLLSLCCTQLNRRRASHGRIDVALVASAAQDILQSFYDEALAGMPARVPRFIETQLIQGDRYRGSYPRDAALACGDLTAAELAELTDRHRLLRIDQQQGVARIELIHDRLVGIVARARDEHDARERDREQQRLREEAERQATIERKRREDAERSRARMGRMRNILLGLAVLLCGALGFGIWFALQAEEQASIAIAFLAAAREQSVMSVAFSPDGSRIVSGNGDSTLRLWDARTGQPLGTPFKGHREAVTSVAFSPDGRRIASGSWDRTIRLWDTNGQTVGRPLERHKDQVNSVAFSRDGSYIVSGSNDHTVHLWNAKTGESLGEPLTGHQGWVESVAFSPDGSRVVSGAWGFEDTLRVWSTKTRKTINVARFRGTVSAVAFSPDGSRIVSAVRNSGQMVLWDARTLRVLSSSMKGHRGGVITSVAFSPDGTRIVSGARDKTLRFWDARTGLAFGMPLSGHTLLVSSVAFSPDGTRIVSGSWDGTIRRWDAHTGQALGEPILLDTIK